MSDWPPIIDLWQRACSEQERCWLMSIIDVAGSAYRRTGAHLLLCESGRRAGTISAGCLEQDLIARLPEFSSLLNTEKAAIISYDSTGAEPYVLNHGCAGTIRVMVEEVTASAAHLLDASFQAALNPCEVARYSKQARCNLVLSTVLETQSKNASVEMCLIRGRTLTSSSEYRSDLAANNRLFDDAITQQARAALSEGRHALAGFRSSQHNAPLQVFHEVIEMPVRLVLFGAQDDSIHLAAMSSMVGFEIHVVDWRRPLLSASRFPQSESLQRLSPELLHLFDFDNRTAVVIMSHDYEADKLAFAAMASHPVCPFIGVMGPRARTEKMLQEFGEPVMSRLRNNPNVRFPVGLDIGSSTPQQIALSITAEILMLVTRSSGLPLRDKSPSVHTPSASALTCQ